MEEEEEEVCPSRQVLATTFGPIGQNQNYNCNSVYYFSAGESSCQHGARVTRGQGVGGTTNGTETQWSSGRRTYGDGHMSNPVTLPSRVRSKI